MTVDEYLSWAEGRPGRYELYAGVVYAMAPERALHATMKFAVQSALLSAIRKAEAPCRVLPDGMTVRIDQHTAYEPDALVYCGPKLAGSALEVPNPVILVEVISRSTRHTDAGAKLIGYFSLASVGHYLIADPDVKAVIHHGRDHSGTIRTSILREGSLRLDPPGIDLQLAEIFSDS